MCVCLWQQERQGRRYESQHHAVRGQPQSERTSADLQAAAAAAMSRSTPPSAASKMLCRAPCMQLYSWASSTMGVAAIISGTPGQPTRPHAHLLQGQDVDGVDQASDATLSPRRFREWCPVGTRTSCLVLGHLGKAWHGACQAGQLVTSAVCPSKADQLPDHGQEQLDGPTSRAATSRAKELGSSPVCRHVRPAGRRSAAAEQAAAAAVHESAHI